MKNANKIALGCYNTLRITRKVDFGVYLDGGEDDDILMPQKYVPVNAEVGDEVDVFVYADSEDRLVATTEKPFATVGQFAYLKVTTVTRFGAFLDWGLTKDLLVPYSEQRSRMQVGESYIVYIYADNNTRRIAATEKTSRYLDNIAPRYQNGEEVDALIVARTDLGYKAIINNLHTGIIYNSDVYRPLQIGQTIKAYISKVRDDDKIDLKLQKSGFDKVSSLRQTIVQRLHENGGRMAVGDKTDPETIKLAFGCSKKAFKMTIGAMYKDGEINIADNCITLNQ